MWATVRVSLTEGERDQLETMSRSRALEGRLVLRARIVLRAATGLPNRGIGEALGIDNKTATRWGNRFGKDGLQGIEQERPGRGRKPRIQLETVLEVLEKTLQARPEHATHWNLSRMARLSGLSKSTVHRIWQSRGLKPHLCEAFKLSKDQDFEAKLVDVVGSYLDPPEHVIARVPNRFFLHELPWPPPALGAAMAKYAPSFLG